MNSLNKYKKIKKAQIGDTMTWIVAFLIITFIMALLVVATISIAKTKGIVSEGKVVLLSMIGLSGKAAYSGLIPFADYSFYIFNSRILIQQNLTTEQIIKKYLANKNSDTQNDARCSFLESSKPIFLEFGIYPGLFIDEKEIAEPNGNDCGELPARTLQFPFSTKNGVSIAEVKFYQCTSTKITSITSNMPDWWIKLMLELEVKNMQSKNLIYGSNCENLESKIGVLKTMEAKTQKDIPAIRTSEESAKISEILNSKLDINISGRYFKFNASKDFWTVSLGDVTLDVDKDSMEKNLVGDNGKSIPDVLNALRKDSSWEISWKTR